MHTKQERTLFDEAPKYGSRLFWLPDPFRYRLDLTILDLTILDCGSILVPFWFRLCSVLVPDLTILYYTILDLTILDCGSVLVPLWFHFGSGTKSCYASKAFCKHFPKPMVPNQHKTRAANTSQNLWFQSDIKREPPTLAANPRSETRIGCNVTLPRCHVATLPLTGGESCYII